MTDTPLLRVHDLRLRFGSAEVLKGVDFELLPGETVALVGESGSGKSVTSLTLMGLLTAGELTGEARFQSRQFGAIDLLLTPERRFQQLRGREIAMIFQEPMSALNPVHRCGLQVEEILLQHLAVTPSDARARTFALFESVRLPDPARAYRAYPHELSGGQKQRVMIAMAMACNPALLIADEPTTALDVTVQAEILHLLAELQRERGMALLFITHDLGVVADIADRVLVLYRGELVEKGSVEAVFQNPQHTYTKGLLACRPQRTAIRPAVLPTVSDFLQPNPPATIPIIPALSVPIAEELICATNLTVRYPIRKGFFSKPTRFVTAVNDISLSLRAGETVALVGESGCGKSTLGRTLLGLENPSAGEVTFAGESLATFSAARWQAYRRQVQLIFQDPLAALDPMQTAGAAIVEPMRIHQLRATDSARRQHALVLLERVGLHPEHFNRYPHEFSGGQRQRLCIARALALAPQVLICDESVSALDVSVQAQVLNLLNQLKREMGLSMLFITHDLNVAWFVADYVLVMQAGRVIEQGEADALFTSPQADYTRKLLAAIPGRGVAVVST